MTRDVEAARPDDSLARAAQRMEEHDVGVLPVMEGDQLLGIITDRDITVRTTAKGWDPTSVTVRDAMTPDVTYCFEDDDIRDAARKMEEKQIRRLVVLNREKRLVGIVSLGDLAVHINTEPLAGEVLERVSEPAGPAR
jgi:CBS domain-containing protein